MRPIMFKHQNRTLLKPSGMEACGSLPVYTDGKSCLSCWRLSFKERMKALFSGRIWLTVHGGVTQSPVSMYCGKEFLKRSK